MAVVKIKNKKLLEQLQAKLTMRMGRKLTQQETLDYCIILADQNLDKLIQLTDDFPSLSPKKYNYFINKRDQLMDVPYENSKKFKNLNDEDIYNL